MAYLLIIYGLSSHGLFGTIMKSAEPSFTAPIGIMRGIISLTSHSSIAR